MKENIGGGAAEQTAGIWSVHEGAPPYIKVVLENNSFNVSGSARCDLGSPYPTPSGSEKQGLFASWHWDGEVLHANTDPLGFFSLFVYSKGNMIAVSPSLMQLIAVGADPSLDERALSVFYRLGMFINNDTPCKHIRVLPPGGKLCWRNGHVDVSGGEYVPRQQVISRDSAVDGIIDLTRTSLRRIRDAWAGDFLLPLSGGRDSRHILLELESQNALPLACLTFHHSGSQLDPEVMAAKAISKSVGVRHLILGQDRPSSRDVVRTMTLTSMCSDEHMQMIPLHDFFRSNKGAALDGIAGDILTNPDDDADGYFKLAQKGDFLGIAKGMMDGHARVITKSGSTKALGDKFSPGMEDEALSYLAESIEKYSSAADPYQAFWFWNRTRREIGFVSSAVFGSADAVFCPFLDKEFVDFCLSLPYEVTKDQQLHNDAMAKAYPRHKNIPFAEGFSRGEGSTHSLKSRLGRMAQGIKTILDLLPQSPITDIKEYVLGSGPIHRKPAEVLRLYTLALNNLSSDFAGGLLKTSEHYRAVSPKSLVSEIHENYNKIAGISKNDQRKNVSAS